jgi:hypothetical protein
MTVLSLHLNTNGKQIRDNTFVCRIPYPRNAKINSRLILHAVGMMGVNNEQVDNYIGSNHYNKLFIKCLNISTSEDEIECSPDLAGSILSGYSVYDIQLGRLKHTQQYVDVQLRFEKTTSIPHQWFSRASFALPFTGIPSDAVTDGQLDPILLNSMSVNQTFITSPGGFSRSTSGPLISWDVSTLSFSGQNLWGTTNILFSIGVLFPTVLPLQTGYVIIDGGTSTSTFMYHTLGSIASPLNIDPKVLNRISFAIFRLNSNDMNLDNSSGNSVQIGWVHKGSSTLYVQTFSRTPLNLNQAGTFIQSITSPNWILGDSLLERIFIVLRKTSGSPNRGRMSNHIKIDSVTTPEPTLPEFLNLTLNVQD